MWRRSFDVPPPAMTEDNEHWAGKDARYKDLGVSPPKF